MKLIVFLSRGETLIFEDVENVSVTTGELKFEYLGVSLSEPRQAVFFRDQIAGITYSAE